MKWSSITTSIAFTSKKDFENAIMSYQILYNTEFNLIVFRFDASSDETPHFIIGNVDDPEMISEVSKDVLGNRSKWLQTFQLVWSSLDEGCWVYRKREKMYEVFLTKYYRDNNWLSIGADYHELNIVKFVEEE